MFFIHTVYSVCELSIAMFRTTTSKFVSAIFVIKTQEHYAPHAVDRRLVNKLA